MTEPTTTPTLRSIADVIPPMKHYIGTKTLRASPMTRAEYVAYRGWPTLPSEMEDPHADGYLVEYDPDNSGPANDPRHAGYISWSPAGVFERVYSEIPREAEVPVPAAPAQPAAPIPRMPPIPLPFVLLPYQQRVVEEHTELTERLGKLIAFSSSNVFKSLPGAERTRMLQQAALMQALSEVLAERINAFEPTGPAAS